MWPGQVSWVPLIGESRLSDLDPEIIQRKPFAMHATLALSAIVCAALLSPGAARRSKDTPPLYDQRQEGGWNVRADLKNFVVVIVPRATAPQASLLDLLTRALRPTPLAHFVQSKTAPYHVDISQGGAAHLRQDEILATQSPPPPEAVQGRALNIVLNVPDNEGESMTLLGAREQCGPGMRRDALGVCRPHLT